MDNGRIIDILVVTLKSWNVKNAIQLKEDMKDNFNVHIITNKEDFNVENVLNINPSYIFIPHWSWIISEDISENFNCVVFHMTDLPFGRGGSPLQNLIERGIENTKISAIKVESGIDSGSVYMKKDLNLNGTAEEIFIRASNIIFKNMIPEIVSQNLTPIEQTGEVVEFKRRNPEQSEIKPDFDLEKIYDYIRMLDGEGYPGAFIKFGKYKLEFSRASFKGDKIIADVEIKEGD